MARRIERDSLLSTEQYLRERKTWREQIIPFKKRRTVFMGNNVSLLFENELTVRYQLQEMLRVDKSLEFDPLEQELEIYNFLIPANGSLKATLMFEFVDSGIRKTKLSQLVGVEKSVWMQVDQCSKIYAIPHTSADPPQQDQAIGVYFLSFDLDTDSKNAFLSGLAVAAGIDHPAYNHTIDELAPETQVMLMEDLKSEQ